MSTESAEEPKTHADAGFDISSIERNWPDGHDVPQLILDVASFVGAMPFGPPYGIVFRGRQMDDYYIEDGADLAAHFGSFLTLGEGSNIALWFGGDAPRGKEPVVNVDGEGDIKIIADTLEGFFAAWGIYDEAHLPIAMHLEDAPQGSADRWHVLGDFLRKRIGENDLSKLVGVKNPQPDMIASFSEYSAQVLEKWKNNPNFIALGKMMQAYFPTGESESTSTYSLINVIGNRMEVTIATPSMLNQELLPPDVYAEVAPLIHAERERRADPAIAGARGLWHCALLILGKGGLVYIKGDWAAEPRFKDERRATRAELTADLARFPRGKRWIEPWMNELT